jgi:hypothetical protein
MAFDEGEMQKSGGKGRDKFFERQQRRLRMTLTEANLATAQIDQVIASGYFAWDIRDFFSTEGRSAVMDSYYGNKMAGLIEIEEFVEYLREGTARRLPSGISTYHVRNIGEALSVLSEGQHARYAGRMSFRGQTMDHHLTRPVPNPRASLADGRERMIVPSWWRPWINKDPAERQTASDRSLFTSPMLAAPLLYRDIPGWQEHVAHAKGRGSGDDDACNVCAQMAAREEEHMFSARALNEAPLLEQHYGMPTIGLDVTFDPATAFFFASHRFPADGGRICCEPVDRGSHHGVVYCFVFEWPPVKETEFLVRDISLFRNLPPLRPIRQHCGLPSFHFNEIAAAARDLHAVFHLDEAFDVSGLPSAAELFPGRDEDRFYDTLLELRQRVPEMWGSIVEYGDL